jgi:hypothetical protein
VAVRNRQILPAEEYKNLKMTNLYINTTPPVLLIAFNRPGEARRVFEQIKLARPSKLYLACDGPRSTKIGEAELVEKVKSLANEVDWPCEVKTRFLTENLGCGRAVSSAIEWFLNDTDEGIILEDDCLPTPAFFRFCATMLDRYRNDPRVGLISGTNLAQLVNLKGSYGFSSIVTCWGWATWRRTWVNYTLSPQPIVDEEPWFRYLPARSLRMLRGALKRITEGDYHTWDYQFLVQMLRHGQLTVVPAVNLVLNIGFGGSGAHFVSAGRPWWVPDYAYNPTTELWVDSPGVLSNKNYDRHYLAIAHAGASKFRRSFLKIMYWFKRFKKLPNLYFSAKSKQ